jgi:hypothetical protein
MNHPLLQDIDSISQISAMDSASQTGGGGCGGGSVVDGGGSACCYSSSSSKFHVQSRSFSSDSNIHRSVSENGNPQQQPPQQSIRRGQFPYAYIRSKLSVLPEEQAGQLSRRESMNQADTVDEMSTAKSEIILGSKGRRSRSTGECGNGHQHDDELEMMTGGNGGHGNHNPSLRMRKMALRRKRSLSVADIQAQPPPAGFEDRSKGHGNVITHFRSEESGYDSDATRKSSPRGSLKHDVAAGVASSGMDMEVSSSSSGGRRDDTDSMSSGSDDSGALSSESKEQQKKNLEDATGSTTAGTATPKKQPEIKKPPRKSKLPEATFRICGSKPVSAAISESNLSAGRKFKKNGEMEDEAANPNSFADSPLNSLTSKRFKMLRLNRTDSVSNGDPSDSGCGEMGIVISKRRHPQKGTTGYIIAHIEEGGIVER